ncbi:MAG: PSD1 and planctomycete cytochrome C domain-containing protein [Bryobacteraceae bacterium]
MPRAVLLLLSALTTAAAADLFREQIEPILRRDCLGCHGVAQTLSQLDLRTRDSTLRGGTRGPALVPGNAAASLLFQAIEAKGALKMPPGDKRLQPAEIDTFRQWIDSGAEWSAAPAPQDKWSSYKEADLWAFRPLRREFRATAIDAFRNAPAPEADRRTLVRRLTFDLTGLPPTPAEVAAFENDRSPDAWRNLVDRLLASPRYGERQARLWLDVARYADSSGYSNDFERPNAWRYRDYVIRAFNTDKPYDRFVREQIAGDEIFPGDAESLIATGFLRMGPWEHTGMSVEAVTRQMFLDDVTNSAGVTFLGLTLGCARCHDHKFDPIPTRDYYRVQATFASTEFARAPVPFLAAENTSRIAEGLAAMRAVAAKTQAGLDGVDEQVRRHVMKQRGVTRIEDVPKDVMQKAIRDKEGVGPEDFEVFKLYQKHMQTYKDSLDRFEPKAFVVSSGPLDGATDGGGNLKYPKRAEYKPAAVHVLTNGNVQSPGERVTPGVLSLVERYSGFPAPEIPESTEGRRAALANWIADPRNPLPARVMANRIWQQHFGTGLAADANNFGKMGKKPTDPELLDWLAAKFIEGGWSVKNLHRIILLSHAYRSSEVSPRRLDAEALRDAVLAVSGELSPEAGGPPSYPQINEDVARQPLHRMGSLAPAYHASALKRDRNRRTIYMFQQRSLVDPMIDVFNGASMDLSCDRRDATTVPTQAFTLLNSQFANDMALAFAARIEKNAPTLDARIRRAFELAYSRTPGTDEVAAAKVHIAKMTKFHEATPPPAKSAAKPLVHSMTSELTGETFRFTQQEDPVPYEANLHPSGVPPATRALADFALALLNSNEFIYVY